MFGLKFKFLAYKPYTTYSFFAGNNKNEMMQFLKKNTINIYSVLLGIVLIGKISNWFFNYSDQTNNILNTAMFCLIGIAYLAFSWAYNKLLLKIIFAICGIYLILMNFIPDFSWNSIIGIICVLIPMLIRRFLPKEYENDKIVAK